MVLTILASRKSRESTKGGCPKPFLERAPFINSMCVPSWTSRLDEFVLFTKQINACWRAASDAGAKRHFQGRRDVLFLNCLWSSDAEVRRSPLSNWNSLPPCRQLLAYPTTGFILLAYPTDLYYLHTILTRTTSLSYWLPALAALYGRSWRAFWTRFRVLSKLEHFTEHSQSSEWVFSEYTGIQMAFIEQADRILSIVKMPKQLQIQTGEYSLPLNFLAALFTE